ncbi:hypothetical protein PssB301D_04182 [Pseudomonas syringae pv. syringae str. B301D-R]|nr:hypothetical protein PsyrB_01110 [Pseudomonas syringae pv. syringae B301D]EXL29595.1 hypothetical protein PssB301D_04182 [Pseudomonas syringae pv. syringae str. B301D-R]
MHDLSITRPHISLRVSAWFETLRSVPCYLNILIAIPSLNQSSWA